MGSKTPKVGLRSLFFSYKRFHHGICYLLSFFMWFWDLESLPASARPMKYALLQKSVFSLSRIISESFLASFWSFCPPQIGANRLWEAFLNACDFYSIFGSHFFDFLIVLGCPGGSLGTPKIPGPTSFWAIWCLLEPLLGYESDSEVFLFDFDQKMIFF